jgi:acyl-CoA thioesterase YciA
VGGLLSSVPRVYENFPDSAKIELSAGKASIMAVDRINPSAKQPSLRVMPMPADVNQNGDVFGGWVMAQVDVAGAIPAMRRARGRVATVSVNSFLFKQPISVGDVVNLYAEIVHTGRTSITVKVEVFAERNYASPETVKVTEAELTYVAIDGNGKKRELPPEAA